MLLPSVDRSIKFSTLHRLLIVGGIYLHVKQNAKMPKLRKGCSGNDMWVSVGGILEAGWKLYKASIEHKIPYNTPKEMLSISRLANEVSILKKEMPYNLTLDDETKIVSYVTERLYTCVGLRVKIQSTWGDTRYKLQRKVEQNESYWFRTLWWRIRLKIAKVLKQ
jgi:hypothetical protein